MSQKLRIPFKKAMMLCGYKNSNYKDAWGYPHYGIDISTKQGNAGTDDKIYGSGIGEVVAAGKDNTLGYGVAVLYKGCEYRYGTTESDIIVRYMHMSSISVAKGDSVTLDTVIGVEGKEGTEDYHLHMEMDTDTKYPVYSPQVSKNHTFWKKGTDTTLNPSFYLWQDDSHTLVTPTYNPAWLSNEDKNIPVITTAKTTEQIPIAYDEDAEENYFGEPAYYIYEKEFDGYRLFDKWWRIISTETFPMAGDYATEPQKKKAKVYTSSIKEKYSEPNDVEGKAGISNSSDSTDSDELATLRAAVTAYEVEKATVLNKLREIITLMEGSNNS